VAMSEWIDDVPAVLEAWMMGQAGAGAIAEVLFGKLNPSGKLAETFPIKAVDVPAHINWPGSAGEVRYGEGIFIGYRYYDAKEMPVLFPFGHGLSYTTFAYDNPRVSASSFKDIDGVTVSVDVTNTGSVAGKEIVQVYVRDHESELMRPEKELKGFAKVELEPSEIQAVDNRGWGFRYSHRRLGCGYPLLVDRDYGIDPGTAVLDRSRIYDPRMDGRSAQQCGLDAGLRSDPGPESRTLRHGR